MEQEGLNLGEGLEGVVENEMPGGITLKTFKKKKRQLKTYNCRSFLNTYSYILYMYTYIMYIYENELK